MFLKIILLLAFFRKNLIFVKLVLASLVELKKYRSYCGKVGKIVPNILQQYFSANMPHQKCMTNMTEFVLYNIWIYLSPILDLYNGEIISYAILDSPNYALLQNL